MQVLTKSEQSKANYLYYKSRKICVNCKKEKTWNGTTLCLVCLMDRRENSMDYERNRRSEQSKQKHSEYLKRLREANRMNGICVMCGTRKSSEGRSTCARCRAKAKVRSEKIRRENGVLPRDMMGKGDICFFCGAPTEHYEKTCDKCHDRLSKQMLYARSKRVTENYFEKLCKSNRQFKAIGGDASE